MTKSKEAVGITRGYIFAEAINKLLREQADNNRLAMNADVMGPIFNQTIEDLHRDGKKLNAATVFTATTLRLHDELKAKKEKRSGEYFVEEGIILKGLGEIALYVEQHPNVEKEFNTIEALQHLPKEGVDF